MVGFNRLGTRVGKRLLMVTFNNERAVEILLNRAALLNRVRHLKHIYIMKDRPKSERPERQVRNDSNRLAEAAAGAINANSETSTEGRGVILNGGATAPASRVQNDRTPQNANGESANANQGATTGEPHDGRSETPNSRMETPNSRKMHTGDAQQGSSARRYRTRILEGIRKVSRHKLIWEIAK